MIKNRSFIIMAANLVPVNGIVQNISQFSDNCCEQQVTILGSDGVTNFIVSPDTYVIGEARLRPGMPVTAFYDSQLAVPLIFPPRYQAVIIGRRNPRENMFAGYFDENLVSENNELQLNIDNSTTVVTSNGQTFSCRPENQMLIVYYTDTTRSIPPQTTPRKVIVMC